MVIMEDATSTTCVYCPYAAMGADDLIANGKLVAVVADHCNIPSTGDPYVWPGSLGRLTLYGITSAPSVVFDGVSGQVGIYGQVSQYSKYLPLYNSRIAVTSPIDMSMTFTNTGLHYDITVTVTKVGTVPAANVKLFFFITESNIARNWFGQHWLHYVNHAMLPSQSGTAIDFTGGDTQVITLSTDLNTAWVLENLEFVATVQNTDVSQGNFNAAGTSLKKREQIQSIKSGVIPLTIDFAASLDHLNLNDSVTFTPTVLGGYVRAPKSYQWSFPGATPSTSTDSVPVVQYTESGAHDVQLIIDKGGEIDTLTKSGYIYVGSVGIKELAGYNMSVYPNPSQGSFTVSFSVQKSFTADLDLVDGSGKTVYSEKGVSISNEMNKTFKLTNLKSGQYFFSVHNSDLKIIRTVTIY